MIKLHTSKDKKGEWNTYILHLFSEVNKMFVFHFDLPNYVSGYQKIKILQLYFFPPRYRMEIGIPTVILLFQTDSNVG